jgi:glycosyltransferase involved in cell wall biosynthesis
MPAAVACILNQQLQVPFSVSAHARDVFVPMVKVPKVCAEARFVTVCSQHAQKALIDQLPAALKNRIVHIPHDVECTPNLPNLREPIGSVFRLLSVCRLVPKKGLDTVLHALALLQSETPDRYRYRILGGGPERRRLIQLVHSLKLNRVEFVGPVSPDTVQKELIDADAFVLGAKKAPDGDRDGIPNAILEAMAAGTPVVVSDAGGVSEVIQHHETGWLVPANDPVSFAQALREVALDNSLRRRIIRNAHTAIWKRVSGNRNSAALAHRLASEMSKL